MDRQTGITLIELMTAIALVAILAGLAVPALDRILLNARRAATMEELLRAAWFARTEAMRRGRPVLLCAAAAAGCDTDAPDWSNGWIIAPADQPERVLRRGGGADPRARLLSNRSAFNFEPRDRRSTNGTLAWCDHRGQSAARSMVIAPTGRPRLQRGSGSLACARP